MARTALVYSVFLAGLICATFIDFEHFIIPDEITLGGIVAGIVASFLLPSLHGARTPGEGMVKSVLGIGGRRGNDLRGAAPGQTVLWPPENKTAAGHENCFHRNRLCLPDKEIPYEEIFYRKTDKIVLHARTVELVDRCYRDVKLRLSPTVAANRR